MRWTLPLLVVGTWGQGEQPLPKIAKAGEQDFDVMADARTNSEPQPGFQFACAQCEVEGMSATMQRNPLQFPYLTDFWCALFPLVKPGHFQVPMSLVTEPGRWLC